MSPASGSPARISIRSARSSRDSKASARREKIEVSRTACGTAFFYSIAVGWAILAGPSPTPTHARTGRRVRCRHRGVRHVLCRPNRARRPAVPGGRQARPDRRGRAMISPGLLHESEALLAACRAAGVTLATAESCTGGLIAATLTAIAGSSDVVDRGFVTYSNEAKTEM